MKTRVRKHSSHVTWPRNAVLLLAFAMLRYSFGRTWKDITTRHANTTTFHDLSAWNDLAYEAASFTFLDDTFQHPIPTQSNIFVSPSRPSEATTRPPSASFTKPTSSPSAPTFPAYPASAETPLRPPREYYNYDTTSDSSAAMYGPGHPLMEYSDNDGFAVTYADNGWENVLPPRTGNYYWDEFGPQGFGPWHSTLTDRQMRHNQCGNVGRQSPIDIRPSGVACVEHHQIRTRPGDFRVSGVAVEKQILPSKLRLLYQRRPCSNLDNPVCAEPDPPHADFPNGWGGFSDVLHIDFKFPSEHRIYGEEFDGEMQIYHLHAGRRRLPVISVMIRAAPTTAMEMENAGYNHHLQEVIDEFQYVFEGNMANCLDEQARRLLSGQAQSTNETLYTHRRLSRIWHPYHESIMPSHYFFGYDGSLTEPPCSEIVSWFVVDTPMIVSKNQLEQMKSILFSNLDAETCQRTSTHHQSSVARPLQENGGRQVWQCTRGNFVPDNERDW